MILCTDNRFFKSHTDDLYFVIHTFDGQMTETDHRHQVTGIDIGFQRCGEGDPGVLPSSSIFFKSAGEKISDATFLIITFDL